MGQPHKVCNGKWLWYNPSDNGYPTLPASLTVLLDADFYPSYDACFVALGAAVRAVHAAVPPLTPEAADA